MSCSARLQSFSWIAFVANAALARFGFNDAPAAMFRFVDFRL